MEITDYHKQVESFLKNRIDNSEDARDLTQEVFLKIVSRNNGDHPVRNFGGWVFAVARNALIDYYRKKNRTQENLIEFEDIDNAERRSLLENMMDCQDFFINKLDPQTSLILTEVEIKGRSQKEVAESLNMSYPTLRSKVQRGRTKLKKMFMETCEFSYDSAGAVDCCWVVDPSLRCKNASD